MSREVKPSWLWAVLFGLLAVLQISAALHRGARAGDWFIAIGFLGMAYGAFRAPSGFLLVTWPQLRSPRTITARQYAGLAGAVALVAGTTLGVASDLTHHSGRSAARAAGVRPLQRQRGKS
jgi:hypothetical protein